MSSNQQPGLNLLLTPPHDPKTPQQWQNAADAADALLKLDAARSYGLVTSGPDVDAERCCELLERARREYGIEPSENAVQRLISEMER